MVSEVESRVLYLEGILFLLEHVFVVVGRDCLGKLAEWTCLGGINHTCI